MRLLRWLKSLFITAPPYDEMLDVLQFQLKLGQPVSTHPVHLTKRKLGERIVHLREELEEFEDACATQNLCEQADALIDLVYIAKGTAVMLGLPWEELWADVHRANMAKTTGVGKRGHKVDAIKPSTWEPPMTVAILCDAGYAWDMFHNEYSEVIEEWCVDDKA